MQYSFMLQKKRRKERTEHEEMGDGDAPNLMQDHEELEGDNTPGASPREETDGKVVENDVGHEKVILRLNTDDLVE